MDDLDLPFDPDPLKVGERVKIVLSGECPGWKVNLLPITLAHHADEDGATGTIRRVSAATGDGHDYYVVLSIPQFWRAGVYYARAELQRAASA